MKLRFEATTISRAAIDTARAEAAVAAEKALAVAFARDEDACQAIVDAGRKHLAMLRKAADDFHQEFEKLKGIKFAPKFVEVLNSLPIRGVLGSVRLTANYEDVVEAPATPAE